LAYAVFFAETKAERYMAAVSGVTVWNSLPLTGVSDPSLTLTQFCVPLKTVLFSTAYQTLP